MNKEIKCDFCHNEFVRSLRQINESQKLKLKSYCSPKCMLDSRLRRKIIICENPQCQKYFERPIGDISLHNYCSLSCSAIINNLSRPKKIRICLNQKCRGEFYGDNKYCSSKCVPTTQPKYSREDLLDKIMKFHQQHKRIPIKKEFYSNWQAYRRVFGTWNKAISEAGFETNPEMFAHKYKAKDGHICDSLAEKIIDDWLFKRKITHQRSVYYPNQRKFKTDFLIGDRYWIEFLGLKGVLKRYDDLYKVKLKIADENKIKIIELYPTDLFPKSKLNQKLSFLLNLLK